MNFYLLDYSLEKKNSAEIYGLEPGYILQEGFQQGDLSYYEFPQETVMFSKPLLRKGSVPVDFINDMGAYGGLGYLIYERAKGILEHYNLPEHKFYTLPLLEYQGATAQYYWMQILIGHYDYSYIDFKKSTFIKTDFFEEGEKETIQFGSGADLEKAFKNLDALKEKILPGKIYLNEDYSSHPKDLFYLKQLFYPFIISERLHNAFFQNNITGIKIDIIPVFK